MLRRLLTLLRSWIVAVAADAAVTTDCSMPSDSGCDCRCSGDCDEAAPGWMTHKGKEYNKGERWSMALPLSLCITNKFFPGFPYRPSQCTPYRSSSGYSALALLVHPLPVFLQVLRFDLSYVSITGLPPGIPHLPCWCTHYRSSSGYSVPAFTVHPLPVFSRVFLSNLPL